MVQEQNVSAQELIDELLCVADTKWVLGHWYIKTMQNGRSLTDFNALAAMSQDVLGHTRAIFSLLEQNNPGAAAYLEFNRSADQIHGMQLLDVPPENWADLMVTAFLADFATSLLFDYSADKHPGLAALSTKCRQECEFHALYFAGVLKGLDDTERKQAQDALNVRLPMALEWLEQRGDDTVHHLGYRRSTLADIQSAFMEQCGSRLQACFLDVGLVSTARDPEHINGWDPTRKRPAHTVIPPALWELILPTNEHAVMCRRPLNVSSADSIRFTAV